MADDLQEDPAARRSRNKEEEKGQEPQKSYETILEQEIAAGLTELERPAKALLLSGLSAGLDVSLGLLLMAVVHTLTDGVLSKPVSEILVALTYASGFLFVVLGRSELFTEHTTLAVLPVLDRRASLSSSGASGGWSTSPTRSAPRRSPRSWSSSGHAWGSSSRASSARSPPGWSSTRGG